MNRFLQVVIISLAGLLIFGALFTIFSISIKEDEMRQDLLTDTRIGSVGIIREDLYQLKGTISDLNSPAYGRIKKYLTDVAQSRPLTRFVYLLGKNPDGELVFLADSEPDTSVMYSHPGQRYHEASGLIRDMFTHPQESVEGPLSDRWGRWVTGLVPIYGPDNTTVHAVLGIDIDATFWESGVFKAVLIPVIITSLLCLLVIILSILWMRKDRERELLQAAEEKARMQAEKLAVQNQELIHVKEELALLTSDLEGRVSEDTVEICKLNEELKERAQKVESLLIQKDQFIYQLAHDLRTPLTPMVAILPLVKEAVSDPDSQSLLDMFQKSLRYMEQMVEDIMELIRLNSYHTIDDVEEMNLKSLIDEEIQANSFMADEKELVFYNHVPPEVSLHLSRVYSHQLFRNLINNAVKFNAFKGTVTIRYHETPTGHEISIQDTGIGIHPGDIHRIWDEFFISDASRHDPESKGLGLSIVRKIVDLHGGTISVDSPGTGKGATFTVMLPKRQNDKKLKK